MDTFRPPLRTLSLLALTVLIAGGCGTVQRAVDSTVSSAGSAAGERVGAAVGDRLAARVALPAFGTSGWNRFMASQAQIFFAYATSAGGYWPAQATYQEGEWTRFRFESQENDGPQYEFERALLAETEGNQWWRVGAQYDEGSWIYEALVDTTESRMLRLRARDPDGNVGEIPVTERTVYPTTQELTQESLEGATTGTVEITVPAGSFTARRIEYSGMSGSGTVTWWLSDEVPGGIVRYEITDDGESVWASSLIDYGDGATTQLDSF